MNRNDFDYRACRVLYVDDEPQALKYFQKAFGSVFTTNTCASAKEAWQFIQEHAEEIGVVISDQRMPGDTGVDLLTRVKMHYPGIVRILTTAYSDLESAVDAVNRGGAFAYVHKPWELDGLQGTLKRAMEYFLIRRERDRLVHEKLSALQRMLVMDRVRGLATLAALLQERLRHSGQALAHYVRQANLKQQIAARAEALSELDMMQAAREECEQLIRALRAILADLDLQAAQPEQPVELGELLQGYVQQQQPVKAEDGVTLQLDAREPLAPLRGSPAMLSRLVAILVDRICNMDSEDRTIRIWAGNQSAQQVQVRITADALPWENGKVASLYSALLPFREWPMGIDMDILAAFLIAHHHGGTIELVNESPFGPGFLVRLAAAPPAAEDPAVERQWLDEVFRSMEHWRFAEH